MSKHHFKQRFAKRVLTRFHMSLILLGTALSGIIFSKLLLLAGVVSMAIRFPLVLVLSYLVFLSLMRLWLTYLTSPYRKKSAAEKLMDAVDPVSGGVDLSPSDSSEVFNGSGGRFGGGGASGIWDADRQSTAGELSGASPHSAEELGQAATEGTGDVVAGLADEGGPVLVVLALLLLILFGGSIYLVYEAPVILSEAAFEFLLAGGLVKKARLMDRGDWLGSVLGATWKAFSFTLGVVLLAGWLAATYCPQAVKLSEVVRTCFFGQ